MFGTHIANFWLLMALSTAALGTMAIISRRSILKSPESWYNAWLYGMAAAALLYLLFLAGNALTSSLPFQSHQVSAVYATRDQAPSWLIALLLLFVIGPGEELFWRGFVQRRLVGRYGFWVGWAAAALLYTVVHLASFNPMLLAAALICGLWWGALYRLTGSIWPCIISHALWDITIFVLLPIKLG